MSDNKHGPMARELRLGQPTHSETDRGQGGNTNSTLIERLGCLSDSILIWDFFGGEEGVNNQLLLRTVGDFTGRGIIEDKE